MPLSEFPVVYKYTSHASAKLIIRNRSLRFGRPTEMNDPFDAYIDDLFDSSLKEQHRDAALNIVDMIENDPAALSRRLGLPFEEVAAVSSMMRAGTQKQRDELFALVVSPDFEESCPQLKAELNALEGRRAALVAQLRDSGIFAQRVAKTIFLCGRIMPTSIEGLCLASSRILLRTRFCVCLNPLPIALFDPAFMIRSIRSMGLVPSWRICGLSIGI